MFFDPFSPEESYSRHLDNEVASQEFPYGKPYKEHFREVEMQIKRIEKQDKKGGKDVKK